MAIHIPWKTVAGHPFYWEELDRHSARVEEVALAELRSVQAVVDLGKVHQMVMDILMKGRQFKQATIVRKDGVLWLHDGHHRLAAEHHLGRKTAKVYVFTLD